MSTNKSAIFDYDSYGPPKALKALRKNCGKRAGQGVAQWGGVIWGWRGRVEPREDQQTREPERDRRLKEVRGPHGDIKGKGAVVRVVAPMGRGLRATAVQTVVRRQRVERVFCECPKASRQSRLLHRQTMVLRHYDLRERRETRRHDTIRYYLYEAIRPERRRPVTARNNQQGQPDHYTHTVIFCVSRCFPFLGMWSVGSGPGTDKFIHTS